MLFSNIASFVAESLSAFMIVENKSFINLLESVFEMGQKMPNHNVNLVKALPTRKQVKEFIMKEQEKKENEF